VTRRRIEREEGDELRMRAMRLLDSEWTYMMMAHPEGATGWVREKIREEMRTAERLRVSKGK
jgi:hypothetical protein